MRKDDSLEAAIGTSADFAGTVAILEGKNRLACAEEDAQR